MHCCIALCRKSQTDPQVLDSFAPKYLDVSVNVLSHHEQKFYFKCLWRSFKKHFGCWILYQAWLYRRGQRRISQEPCHHLIMLCSVLATGQMKNKRSGRKALTDSDPSDFSMAVIPDTLAVQYNHTIGSWRTKKKCLVAQDFCTVGCILLKDSYTPDQKRGVGRKRLSGVSYWSGYLLGEGWWVSVKTARRGRL